jgi:hypothetical protein
MIFKTLGIINHQYVSEIEPPCHIDHPRTLIYQSQPFFPRGNLYSNLCFNVLVSVDACILSGLLSPFTFYQKVNS